MNIKQGKERSKLRSKKEKLSRIREWANDTTIEDFMKEHNVTYMEARETIYKYNI